MRNGAHVAIDCVDLAMGCDLDFVIADSTVEVVRNGDWGNPFFSNYGDVIIDGSTVSVDNPVACDYSTIYAAENVTISRPNVTASSKTSIAIWAQEGDVAIQDSVVAASSPANWEAVRAGGKITADNSWIQATGKDLGNNFAYTNSAVFLNGTGEVAGNLVLPGSATIGADMQLIIPQGATVSVPAGVTLTNSGTVYVMGEVKETGGTIVCNSHAGGTATCQ